MYKFFLSVFHRDDLEHVVLAMRHIPMGHTMAPHNQLDGDGDGGGSMWQDTTDLVGSPGRSEGAQETY